MLNCCYELQLEAANIPFEVDLVQEHFIDSIKADSVRLGTALVSKVSHAAIPCSCKPDFEPSSARPPPAMLLQFQTFSL